MTTDELKVSRLGRLDPLVAWLPRYERRWLRGDLTAGVAVTALVVPKNLGYAGIAGVPLQNGLYASGASAGLAAQPGHGGSGVGTLRPGTTGRMRLDGIPFENATVTLALPFGSSRRTPRSAGRRSGR